MTDDEIREPRPNAGLQVVEAPRSLKAERVFGFELLRASGAALPDGIDWSTPESPA